jgi:hypothetical protein
MSDGRLLLHVAQFFPSHVVERQRFDKGPVEARIPGFEILIVQPKDPEDGWRYLSDGARDVSIHDGRNEYLLEAPSRDDVHLETLSMVANFHAKQEHGGFTWAASSTLAGLGSTAHLAITCKYHCRTRSAPTSSEFPASLELKSSGWFRSPNARPTLHELKGSRPSSRSSSASRSTPWTRLASLSSESSASVIKMQPLPKTKRPASLQTVSVYLVECRGIEPLDL